MRVTPAVSEELDTLAEMWVDLAADQRAHGSHIRSDANRETVRDALGHAIVANDVLVARDDSEAERDHDTGDGETEIGSDLLGFIQFSLKPSDYEQDCTRGVISNVYVRPGARKSGIGAQLLSTAEASLEKRGADVISLEAMTSNADARRFYRRHGYDSHRVVLEKSVATDESEPATDADAASAGNDTDTRLDG